ncbi:MAG: YfcE family phosphodiesterase [Ruminococcaceae bacterium]|nr:YfcE family phosphodiesterase [Oscillospiraceae bacterium]
MKILLLSDSHGKTDRIDEVLTQCVKPDILVHCGDIDNDCDYLQFIVPHHVPIVAVCGNNDWYSNRPYYTIETIGGVRTYITHGHQERVKFGVEGLLHAAKKFNCKMVLFGHTHQAIHETIDGIDLINPGALTGPHPTYAIVTIENQHIGTEFFSI